MTPELHHLAWKHAKERPDIETSGLAVFDGESIIYWPCGAEAPRPDSGRPRYLDMIAAEDAGTVVGLIHSHPDGDTTPSPLDIEQANLMQLPWWIIDPVTGNWTRLDPVSRPLLGRPFVMGVDDCWSICREWYSREHNVSIPDFVRSAGFWERGFEPHVVHLDEAGFCEVTSNGLEKGDGLLFRVADRFITHCGVYLGNGEFLHHIDDTLSRKEKLDPKWMRRVAKVVRRKP